MYTMECVKFTRHVNVRVCHCVPHIHCHLRLNQINTHTKQNDICLTNQHPEHSNTQKNLPTLKLNNKKMVRITIKQNNSLT